MTFLHGFNSHDHSWKVFIDYALVIVEDAAYNDLVYFIDFSRGLVLSIFGSCQQLWNEYCAFDQYSSVF